MAKIEKTEQGWTNSDVPGGYFSSRDVAREAGKGARQDQAEATYAENVALSEALDAVMDADAADLTWHAAEEFDHVSEPLVASDDKVSGFEQEERELTDGTVSREVAQTIKRRDNFLYMATHTEGPARLYWENRVKAEGWGEWLERGYVDQYSGR